MKRFLSVLIASMFLATAAYAADKGATGDEKKAEKSEKKSKKSAKEGDKKMDEKSDDMKKGK
jgi:Ni/Co efflux regulator RcnB